jgi:UDP-N-acetyl-D-mannosaminuronic acid dehydrogenase
MLLSFASKSAWSGTVQVAGLTFGYHDRNVCIIGLGYVGLTLAVAMAEAGFRVRGIERDPKIVECIERGEPHFSESGLRPRLATQVAAGQFTVSSNWPAAGDSTVHIITVGTPLSPNHSTKLDSICEVSSELARILRDGDIVVLRSTVRIGVSRDIVKPILDTSGARYDLAFCPERTLEGKALLELKTLPQIVGGLNERSVLRACQMFNFITPTTIRVRDLETAEMIKLINNSQRDLMFAFANEVAEMCDAVGVSAIEVIRAGNMGYARSFVPVPGPVGGPCLEKDPHILVDSVSAFGAHPRLPVLGRAINEEIPDNAVRLIAQALGGREVIKIAIAGLAFKGRPETSDLRGTLAIPLIASLRRHFSAAHIFGFDPAVRASEIRSLNVEVAETIEHAFDGSNCVIFQTNNARFEALDLSKLSRTMRQDGVIYDFWNQFDVDTFDLLSTIKYFGLGTKVLASRNRSGERSVLSA